MTIIRFTYSAGYHRPATGGVVFMPHRKHAANETVVLPRPFTRTLVDGVVEVDLEPTSDDWLWSVTHDQDTRFYAIPDTDGVTNHTDLIPVAPSTLTHRIEPVWWAELRQHQQFITDYVNESRSNVREAIDTVNTVHTTLQTAVADAQRHESVAGAYSRQAQASNEQAWEASKGPDGAAERAKNEADRAEIYRNEANTHRQDAATSASTAETHATTAQTAAQDAKDDADRAQAYADSWEDLNQAVTQSQTARDEAVTARDEAVTARDEAVTAADRAETAADYAEHLADHAGPVDTLHVFLAVGQSNMAGRGLPLEAPVSPRILQYGYNNRIIEQAPPTLDMIEVVNPGTSPATFFAYNYMFTIPKHVGVLIIPAARGGTIFQGTPEEPVEGWTWTKNAAIDPNQDLYTSSVIQTLEAIDAAHTEGYRTILKGVLWLQGEGNGSLGTEAYAQHLDALISDYRDDLDHENLPFIVGQMNRESFPEGSGSNRDNINTAHKNTVHRVPHTGFARGPLGTALSPDDKTHYNTQGNQHLGETYYEGYIQALGNTNI